MTKIVSERLVKLRQKESLTQEALGDILGTSRSKVSSWEIGRRDLSIGDAVEVCNYYNISLDSLLNPDGISFEKLLDISNTFVKTQNLTSKEKELLCKEIQKVFGQEEKLEDMPA